MQYKLDKLNDDDVIFAVRFNTAIVLKKLALLSLVIFLITRQAIIFYQQGDFLKALVGIVFCAVMLCSYIDVLKFHKFIFYKNKIVYKSPIIQEKILYYEKSAFILHNPKKILFFNNPRSFTYISSTSTINNNTKIHINGRLITEDNKEILLN